MAMLLMTLCDP